MSTENVRESRSTTDAAGLKAGVLGGLAAYAATLNWLGFTPVERRLVGTLADRYRDALA